MEVIQSEFKQATTQGVLPGVVLAAANRDGSLKYLESFGSVSLENGARPTSSSTTFVLASATKIVTCVAAMQIVEQGLVSLDEDISIHLPEWKDAMILTGFDENNERKPILEKASREITLRLLLSHTSGITGLENERIMQWYSFVGSDRGTVIQRYFMSDDPTVKAEALGEIREIMGTLDVVPLLFEPGTKWSYGQSTDWAGVLIERLTHISLEEYCQQNIFKPLGMTSTSYRPLEHPHIATNLMNMHARNKEGKVEEVDSIYPVDPKIDLGGSNLFTSGPDFIKFLSAVLNDKLLRPGTADIMFNWRLPDMENFKSFKTDEENVKDWFDDMAPDGMQVDHCLAGMVVTDGLKGGRKAGTVNWAGATSCSWWIDRTAGICGFYGSQIMLMNEQRVSAGFFRKFEKAIYAAYDDKK